MLDMSKLCIKNKAQWVGDDKVKAGFPLPSFPGTPSKQHSLVGGDGLCSITSATVRNCFVNQMRGRQITSDIHPQVGHDGYYAQARRSGKMNTFTTEGAKHS